MVLVYKSLEHFNVILVHKTTPGIAKIHILLKDTAAALTAPYIYNI